MPRTPLYSSVRWKTDAYICTVGKPKVKCPANTSHRDVTWAHEADGRARELAHCRGSRQSRTLGMLLCPAATVRVGRDWSLVKGQRIPPTFRLTFVYEVPAQHCTGLFYLVPTWTKFLLRGGGVHKANPFAYQAHGSCSQFTRRC